MQFFRREVAIFPRDVAVFPQGGCSLKEKGLQFLSINSGEECSFILARLHYCIAKRFQLATA